MKKQKMLKLTAFLANPAIENAFSAPVTHSGEISVVFRGRNISIHGWDGSSWSMIYTWNSIDPQFKFDNTYQSYYLKSLNGSEETINVSFFSTESYQGSTPALVGIDRGTKLYDIDEVPIYTADDHNKMLTVMSNGSLAWLLANESFIIPPAEGEAGGGNPNAIAGTFLEELTTSLNNINGAQISNGIFSKIATSGNQGATINLESEGIIQFNADGSRVDEELTLSFWFRPDAQAGWNTGWRYIGGSGGNSNNYFRLAISENSNGKIEFRPIIENLWTSSPRAAGSRDFTSGEWYHIALTYTSNGSGYDLKMFVDGVKSAELLNQNMNLMKFPSRKEFGMGGYSYANTITANSAPIHSIDSLQIGDGVALTEAQVALIAGQSDRQMSIETAAQEV